MSPATLTGPPPSADGDELRLWDETELVHPPAPARDEAEVPSPAGPEAGAAGRASHPARGAPTLEALISGAWEGLSAHASVACPACGAEMRPRAGAGPAVEGGRCGGCGSELS